jgi:hypothetical protein
MKNTTGALSEWAIKKINAEYPDDVALLVAVDGISVAGDGHGECFDYFVPVTERGNRLSRTFIIDGIGYDLYPRSWERTEKTALLEARPSFCLMNARILYSRSQGDTDKFEAMRQKLSDNLKDRNFTYKKALAKLDAAMNLYRTLMFEEKLFKARMAAGYIAEYLATGLSWYNGTVAGELDIASLASAGAELPEKFLDYCAMLQGAGTIEENREIAHMLIGTTRRFLATRKSAGEDKSEVKNYAELADWYQELKLTWRNLNYYCNAKDARKAYEVACFLQNELLIEGEEFGFGEPDLLGSFDAHDLRKLSSRAVEIEVHVRSVILSHGVTISEYATVDEFLANN